MSNIHGMGDYNQGGGGGGDGGRPDNGGGNFDGSNGQLPNFLNQYVKGNPKPPRKETFLDMLKYTFAPELHWGRFVALVSLFDVLMFVMCFVASLVICGDLSQSQFLGADQDIYRYFDKNPIKIADDYQIWRLLTATVLHLGLSHLVSNICVQIVFGSLLEAMVGFKHTMALYFVSGIMGNIFSSFCDPSNLSVGASTCINGLLTGLLALLIINWSAFNGNQALEQTRCILLFFIILAIVFNLLMIGGTGSRASVDGYGHLGGAITGLLWGLAFLPRVKTVSGVKMRKIGMIGFALFFILFTTLLFTLR